MSNSVLMVSMQKSADGYASETMRQLGVSCDDLGSVGERSGEGQVLRVRPHVTSRQPSAGRRPKAQRNGLRAKTE